MCQSCAKRHIRPHVVAAHECFYYKKKGYQYQACRARLGNELGVEQQKAQGRIYAMIDPKNETK